MERLSKDDIFNIAIKLDLKDLLNFCKTSKYINSLLNRNSLWLYNIKKYCPSLDPVIMNKYRNDRSWKQYYIQDLYPTLKKDLNKVLINSSVLGRLDFVIAALDSGADIHVENDFSVRYASRNDQYETVKLLIEHDADIHANTDEAVRYASERGHYNVVKLLIENGADIHANTDEAVRTASMYGHYKTVKLLIENGADIHANIDYAVRKASENGHYETVKLLIENGADIHARFVV